MLAAIWYTFLYQPLFNALIWIYNHWTEENLGWAVIFLTICIRVALLPFTVLDEMAKKKNQELTKDIQKIQESYKNDPVTMREEVRRMLSARKVKPWAKATVLGIQLLMLILLYQVFLLGVTGERVLKTLYPTVRLPGTINVDFYGFDISAPHDIVWAGIVAAWLFFEIYVGMRKRVMPITKGEVAYLFLFPFFVGLFLWYLPMVKSIFILTSMLFSLIIGFIIRSILPKPKEAIVHGH